jgi:hypothetical protein
MRASRSLPDGFVLGGTIRLRGNRPLWRTLSLLSVPWGVASICGVAVLTSLVRPEGWTFDARGMSPVLIPVVAIVGMVVTLAVTIVLHEAAHGVLLWIFTGSRPVFGFKGLYAYSDAPGWYLSRGQMVTVLAAPLVVLPLIGLPLIAYTSAGVSLLLVLGLVVNSVAAIADLYMIGLALRIRGPVYFGDEPGGRPGESGSWYVPAEDRGPIGGVR